MASGAGSLPFQIVKTVYNLARRLFGKPPAAGEGRLLRCVQCRQEFVFEKGEQEFYREKGFQEPKRCPRCRKTHRSFRGRRRR